MKEKVERHSGGEYKVEYFESRDLSELLKEVVTFTPDVNISVNDILVFPSMDSDEEDIWVCSVYYTSGYET